MSIMSEIKKADLFTKLLNGENDNLLPYQYVPQKIKSFPHENASHSPQKVSPESMGVSSEYLLDFYFAISNTTNINPQGLLVMRHGKIISLGMWKPFKENYQHITHSLCKSIVSMAIGIACNEGLMNVNEKICSIFSEKVPMLATKRMHNITIENLLTMTSGNSFGEIGSMLEKDWIKGFFESDMLTDPGLEFSYNSMNTYLLSAIIKKKTGKGLVEYLTPRLFKPLGIDSVIWEKCPMGIEKGGWGCYLTIKDMSKLGQLYLQKGSWNVNGEERQLVPEQWVLASTTEHIGRPKSKKGYGYQIWMCPMEGAYQFNGMFGQYVFVIPKHDIVIVVTAASSNLLPQGSTNDIVYKYFNDDVTFSLEELEPNELAYQKLTSTLNRLVYSKKIKQEEPQSKLPWYQTIFTSKSISPPTNILPTQAQKINGLRYEVIEPTSSVLPMTSQCVQCNLATGIEMFSFAIENEQLVVSIKEKYNTNKIKVGFTKHLYGDIELKGEVYTAATIGEFKTDEDDNMVLKLQICFIETGAIRNIKIFFINNTISVKMEETPSVKYTLEAFASIDTSAPQTGKDKYTNYRLENISSPILIAVMKNKIKNTIDKQ